MLRKHCAVLLTVLVLAGLATFVHAQTKPIVEDPTAAPRLDGEVIRQSGRISLAVTGVGTISQLAQLEVDKPSGATVRAAYLATATVTGTTHRLQPGDVRLAGQPVTWIATEPGAGQATNYLADVTQIVKPILDAAASGQVMLTIEEFTSDKIDGDVLAVIYDDPNEIVNNSVTLYFGGATSNRVRIPLEFDNPVRRSDPRTRVEMGLGISGSAQTRSLLRGGASFDRLVIDVDGVRMTTAAGGHDDGVALPGGLLTAGGSRDDLTAPVDPMAEPTQFTSDDERYDLTPFLRDGSRRATVDATNDGQANLFFAGVFASVPRGDEGGESLRLTPPFARLSVGSTHDMTVTYTDTSGTGAETMVEVIITGANPDTLMVSTDANGVGAFSYVGTNAGTDGVTARAMGVFFPLESPTAEVIWEEDVPPQVCTITLEPKTGTAEAPAMHEVFATLFCESDTIPDERRPPLPNITVQFQIIGGPHTGASGTSLTDMNGVASFLYEGTAAGIDTIVASAVLLDQEVLTSDPVTFTWTEADPGEPTLSLTLAPETATRDLDTEHTLTATVVSSGEGGGEGEEDRTPPVPGVEVFFTVVAGPNMGTTGSATTDTLGSALFVYTGKKAGTDTIEATAMVDTVGLVSNRATCDWRKKDKPVDYKLTLRPTKGKGTLCDTTCVTATLWGDDEPVEGEEVGIWVIGGPNEGTSFTGETDKKGRVEFCYNSMTSGLDTLQAIANIDSATSVESNLADFEWEKIDKEDVTLELTPKKQEADEGTSATVKAQVLACKKTPAAEVTIEFEVWEGPNKGLLVKDTTDADGCATLEYTSKEPGLDKIVAYATLDGMKLESGVVEIDWLKVEDDTTGGDDEPTLTGVPNGLELLNAVPNPFNPVTRIQFGVPQAGRVTLDVFDVRGRRVANLIDRSMGAGYHSAEWRADGFASGIYFFRLSIAGEVKIKRAVLVK